MFPPALLLAKREWIINLLRKRRITLERSFQLEYFLDWDDSGRAQTVRFSTPTRKLCSVREHFRIPDRCLLGL